MNTDRIIEHLDLWTSAVTYNNGKGRGNKAENRVKNWFDLTLSQHK